MSTGRARFLEFLVIGVVAGVAEDLIAVHLATGSPITWQVVGVVVVVAIPFAALSELVVDREDVRIFHRLAERFRGQVSRA
ncbi:MAG: hypothetical protein ABEK12_03105 [Candidatus Nanohaloarchaea archaeon]